MKITKETLKYIKKELESCSGQIGFYYKDLVSNEEYGYNENQLYLAASMIKLPVYGVIMKYASEGKVDLNRKIQIEKNQIKPSCGAINLFSSAPSLDLHTICNFMIALSDNTAANIAIDQCGIETLNNEFKKMGFSQTHIERKIFDQKGANEGKENYFVPAEIGMFLEKIYYGDFVNKKTSIEMIETLKKQNINHKIPGLMQEVYEVAHKTGEDDFMTHDAGIVYCDNPFIVVFASNNTDTGTFEDLIRRVSLLLVKENSIKSTKFGNLVKLTDIDDGFILDLKYATTDNFTGVQIYKSNECYIDKNTALLLIRAKNIFKSMGYRLKIWDAYRPISAQKKFWEIMPDDEFIAKPPVITEGMKYRPTHMNGLCVDVTLTDMQGVELDMPSSLDDFTDAARLDCPETSVEKIKNATILRDVMEHVGFQGYESEWWHFYDVSSPITPFSDYDI